MKFEAERQKETVVGVGGARGCGSGVTRAPRFLSLGLSLHIWKTPDQAILTF